MKKILLFIILIFIATSYCNAYAGGPLVVKGGMAVTYGTRPFLYRYDKGTLGTFSNSEAIDIIESLYMSWQAVPTGEIKFERDNPGSLDVDVTEKNFDPILNSQDLLGYTPVIFDTDGKLLDAFLGNGAGNSVLGLSGPITVSSGPLVNQIAESQAIFNGKFVNGIDTPSDPESSPDALKGTIIHETGHGIGLDHAQINLEAIKPGSSQTIKDTVPLMFPVAVNDLFLIRRDDASAVSLLYPNQSQLTGFGKIEGKIFRANGMTIVQGANVIARNINDPALEAISSVSDYLNNESGSYTLFAVPPGDYRIELEPIDLSFTGGSGVGPFAASKTDKSFQDPVPKGFYTGPDLPITTDQSKAQVVTVHAGQAISNANIIASESVASSSSTSSSGSPNLINEEEPNDSVAQAQVITPPVSILGNCSSSDTGDIELGSDTGAMITISDIFKFTLTQSTSINALLTLESDSPGNDLDLVLFNSNASEIIDTSSQTGNVDELITKSLMAGTYLLGVGAFSGTTPYTLALTVSGGSQGIPVLNLSGPDSIILKPVGSNKASIMAMATDFSASSKCKVFTSSENNTHLKTRPAKFSLSSSMTSKTFMLIVPKAEALNLISNEVSDTATVNVTCENGANDEISVTITPTVDKVTVNRNWHILRTKE
ncbi:MAG: pre-peptidase C-terminal domain-containing protein [Candidatus Melainabacteria bacterium]|nr:pre-peptidase C-terminal domain-containing protein [Candidatus Melainabacteria bacterium]